ncbi:uncharacterized protein LOC117340884 isoform X2 [Pecten maximus]|uniref:uncharacterized protein LOC117340884 isoform X2 n=1 Tax=Pecten maximus TaxID=6579 RepID=UPI0014591654|nr:uncharacterized protein LOC117340884 isoform X2 [Pecten maximus]
MILLLTTVLALADAVSVTMSGSSEYAVPGTDFTLSCNVSERAFVVSFFRLPYVTTAVGVIQVGIDQCYTTIPYGPCIPDVCSCVSSGRLGTLFRWVIQPQTGDHGSAWFCRATLPYQKLDSVDYRLKIAAGPGKSMSLSPPTTSYTMTEGSTLPDITCTADCRPGCTFVWTRQDNITFTLSPVLSLGHLDISEQGTYTCSARNDQGESSLSVHVVILAGPGKSMSLSPPTTSYTMTEGSTLPDITCTADCRPGCTFVWTRQDNITFTLSPVLSLGHLDISEQGTYTCSARNDQGESSLSVHVVILDSVDVGCATQESASSTSFALTTVGAVLFVVAIAAFGISVTIYRKARLLRRSNYQDIDPTDMGMTSHYDSTTGAVDTGMRYTERNPYQELDVNDIEAASPYDEIAGVRPTALSDTRGKEGQRTRSYNEDICRNCTENDYLTPLTVPERSFPDTTSPEGGHLHFKSNYQDIDPTDMGMTSHYDSTTGAVDTGMSYTERDPYQELDVNDIEAASPYDEIAGERSFPDTTSPEGGHLHFK